jgi:CRP/FNR family cyclic AMP-dependent transcriptional regulator
MRADIIGYVASGFVFATFVMKEMVPLRAAAICGNIAFIAYGLCAGLSPIWVLHVALLPLNGWRLAQAIACRRQAQAADPGADRQYRHPLCSCMVSAENTCD